ncbi:MAG: rod shape-determining protein MreD [Desulfuromonadales bacterium]|nr:rod shape-determining protein MreD [Desulfuromonadales bacterium]
MIRNLSALFIIFGAVVLQTSVLPIHLSSAFKPDLLLIAMVYIALRGSLGSGAILAWVLGLTKDVFSGLYLGLNAFTFLIIFLIIKSISDRLYAESGELFVVTVGVATLVCVTADLILLIMLTSSPGIVYSMTTGVLPHLLANAFAASLVTLLPVFSSPQEVL